MIFASMPETRLRQIAGSRSAEDQSAMAQDDSTLELLHELEGVNWATSSDPVDVAGAARRHTDNMLQNALTYEGHFLKQLRKCRLFDDLANPYSGSKVIGRH